jgi:N-acetylmuramoyl-L-alanine amidase
MKKALLIFTFCTAALLNLSSFAHAQSYRTFSMPLYLLNQDQPAQIDCAVVNKQHLVSGTQVFRKLGGITKYSSSNKILSVKLNSKRITMVMNKKVAYVGAKRVPLTTPSKVINNKPMIPLNFILQTTGIKLKQKSGDSILYTYSSNINYKAKDTTGTKLIKSIYKKPSRTVIIDAGHGGEENGALYGGISEKKLNLNVSLRLYKLLKNCGVKVYLTRTSDKTRSLLSRSEIANKANAALFVSVHHNALPTNKSYTGTETLYNPYGASMGNLSGKRLAQIVQNELVKKLGTISRGIIKRPNLSVLRHTEMPSIIAEIGYMTNSAERRLLNTSKFKQKAAEALCIGILKALNEM